MTPENEDLDGVLFCFCIRRADLVPSPSVTVKPLEWADLGDGTFRALLPIIGSIRVEPYGCCDWWEVVWSMPGQCDKLIPDVFDSPDDAKAAAQAEYEARILSAIHIATPDNDVITDVSPYLNRESWLEQRRERRMR